MSPIRYAVFIILVVAASVAKAADFEAHLAPFSVTVNARKIAHDVSFRAVLPNTPMNFTMLDAADNATLILLGNGKTLASGKTIKWTAPAKPGHYPLSVAQSGNPTAITLQVFVMHPSSSVVNGKLNNYNIGNYPPPLKNLESYQAPFGFIEVTQNNRDVRISPHFTLGQFLCKQQSDYPKYVALKPRLLEKLEFLLATVNKKGIRTDEFVVMSGYRTPFYNRAIGNVPNSRHIYGGAADVYIDVSPKDGVMDDLNKDGKVDLQDSKFLYNIADGYVRETGKTDLVGGVGLYKATASHGPFVHVDVRGSKARW